MPRHINNDRNSAEITLYDSNDSVLYKGPFMDLPLDDSLVRRLCMEYFSDPEPCFIHCSAAAFRILYEVEVKLRRYSDGKDMTVSVEYLSREVREILSGGGDISAVQLFWPAVPYIS